MTHYQTIIDYFRNKGILINKIYPDQKNTDCWNIGFEKDLTKARKFSTAIKKQFHIQGPSQYKTKDTMSYKHNGTYRYYIQLEEREIKNLQNAITTNNEREESANETFDTSCDYFSDNKSNAEDDALIREYTAVLKERYNESEIVSIQKHDTGEYDVIFASWTEAQDFGLILERTLAMDPLQPHKNQKTKLPCITVSETELKNYLNITTTTTNNIDDKKRSDDENPAHTTTTTTTHHEDNESSDEDSTYGTTTSYDEEYDITEVMNNINGVYSISCPDAQITFQSVKDDNDNDIEQIQIHIGDSAEPYAIQQLTEDYQDIMNDIITALRKEQHQNPTHQWVHQELTKYFQNKPSALSDLINSKANAHRTTTYHDNESSDDDTTYGTTTHTTTTSASHTKSKGLSAPKRHELETQEYGSPKHISNVLFTKNDEYCHPRVSKDPKDKRLISEAIDMANIVVDISGANKYDTGTSKFDTKPTSSLLQLLQNNAVSDVEHKELFDQLNFKKDDFQKSLESIHVFYPDKLKDDTVHKMVTYRNWITSKKHDKLDTEAVKAAGERVISGLCHIFNDNKFKILDKAIPVTVFDMSAPDLQDWSSRALEYINTDNTFNKDKYKEEMEIRTKLLLIAADYNKCDSIILPSIGAGAFAKASHAGPDYSDDVAGIIAQCFKEHLTTMNFKTLKNVTFSTTGNKHYIKYNEKFSDFTSDDLSVTITKAEMTNIAIKYAQEGWSTGYIIAGHPTRPIGNGYKVDVNGNGAQAQEETCTKHFLDFIATFDPFWNLRGYNQGDDHWHAENIGVTGSTGADIDTD